MSDRRILGILILTLLATGVYIQFDDIVRFGVFEDRTSLYSKVDGRWKLSGTEINSLWDGSTKLNRDLSETYLIIKIDNITNTSNKTRVTTYRRGPVIIDEYFFDGNINDIEKTPAYHKIKILNASGYIYQYEVRNLIYSGETVKNADPPFKFGRNVSVEIDDGWYWNTVYKSGILKARWRVASDELVLYNRLYDPWPNNTFTICKKLTITEVTGLNYDDLPMFIENVNSSGHALADGSDIRIFNSSCGNDGTEITFGLQKNSGSDIFNISFIGNITANQVLNYSIYYGNTTPVSAANTTWDDNRWNFNDEYNGDYLDNTTVWNITGCGNNTNISIVDGKLILESFEDGTNCYIFTIDDTICKANTTIEYLINNAYSVYFAHNYAGGLMGYGAGEGPGDYYFNRANPGNVYYRDGSQYNIGTNTYIDTTVTIDLFDTTMNYSDTNNNTDTNRTISLGSGYDESLYLFVRSVDTSASRADFDYVRVSTYISTPPIYVIGPESLNSSTYTYIWFNGTQSNKIYNIGDFANITTNTNIAGLTLNLTSNMTGWTNLSNATYIINITNLTTFGTFYFNSTTTGNTSYRNSTVTRYITVINDTIAPMWYNNTSSAVSVYSPTEISKFNITWSDADDGNVSVIFLEGNWSGSAQNYTLSNITPNLYNYSVILPAGDFYWKSYANDTHDNWTESDTWTFTVSKSSALATAYLNGSEAYNNYKNESDVLANLTGASNVTGLEVYLSLNTTGYGNNFTNSTTTAENITNITSLGLAIGTVLNFTVYIPETENYTSSSDTNYFYIGLVNLTLDFPENTTKFSINATGHNGTFYPYNQTSANPIYNITNTGELGVSVEFSLNESLPSCMFQYFVNNSTYLLNYTYAVNVTTAEYGTASAKLSANESLLMWFWIDYINCTAGLKPIRKHIFRINVTS